MFAPPPKRFRPPAWARGGHAQTVLGALAPSPTTPYHRRDDFRPVHIGLAGVAPLLKLATISARLGIGDSVRFLTKQKGLLGNLVRPGGYAPDELIAALADAILDDDVGIAGFHVYTFNQVETTEEWRQEFLAELSNG